MSRGGVASVVGAWEKAGLFDRWPIKYLVTHVEGSKLTKGILAVAALLRLTTLIILRRVACLHVHVARRNSFWRKMIFVFIARIAGRPVIVHLHSGGFFSFYEKECGWLGKKIVTKVLDQAEYIVVLSTQWKKWLTPITQNKKIITITNFVTEDNFGGNKVREKSYSLLFLGRLCKDKGIFDLLDAVRTLQDNFPLIRLRCCGEGDENDVRDRAAQLGIEKRVDFLGWVDGMDKKRELNSATVFVLPSYYEGVPMGVLEAMAVELPVVTTAVGGIPDIITESIDGFLVEPGDVTAMSAAIGSLLSDKGLSMRIGVAAKNKILDRFVPEKVLPRLEAIYKELRVHSFRV